MHDAPETGPSRRQMVHNVLINLFLLLNTLILLCMLALSFTPPVPPYQHISTGWPCMHNIHLCSRLESLLPQLFRSSMPIVYRLYISPPIEQLLGLVSAKRYSPEKASLIILSTSCFTYNFVSIPFICRILGGWKRINFSSTQSCLRPLYSLSILQCILNKMLLINRQLLVLWHLLYIIQAPLFPTIYMLFTLLAYFGYSSKPTAMRGESISWFK